MTTDLRDFEDETTEALPEMEDNFVSPPIFHPAAAGTPTRVAAPTKMRGGKDARKERAVD